MSFLDVLNSLYQNVGDNETEPVVTECISKIDHQAFHVWLMVPSVIMVACLSFTISRKNIALNCCHGRPGAVFPMDILGKSNRFSYVAAWGAVAYLAAEVVFEQKFALRLVGRSYVTAANGLLSMMIYGLDYFPLFAALALESVAGYIVGSLYAFMLFGVQVYKATECDLVYQTRLILILRDIPKFLCLGYLCISLPVRMVKSLRESRRQLVSATEMVSVLNMTKEVGKSPEAMHVRELLKPIPAPPPPPEKVGDKILALVKDFLSNWIYHPKKNFRYSSRVLSVMFMGVILLYKVTLEIMVLVLSLLTLVEKGFILTMSIIGWVADPEEEGWVTETRSYTLLLYYFLIAGRGCFIASWSMACLIGLLQIVHMLSSYRTNLFDLYKGDNTHIPHRSTRSNASLLVGCMRYAGYQLGYIAWGFIITFLILFLVSVALAVIITMIREGFYQWMIDVLVNAWPVVLVTIFVQVGQLLLAKLAFLQESGNLLAINNRRMLFSATFFLFFYNIFIGLVSCLLRIIKSMAIGALFLCRLDNSALPRRFQMFDPGFAAYVGFITVEMAHMHPVLLMFLRLLMLEIRSKSAENHSYSKVIADEEKGFHDLKALGMAKKSNKKVRSRWFLLYTLHHNPQLRTQRKSYINYMNWFRQKLAKRFNISHDQIGSIMEDIKDNDISISDIEKQLDQEEKTGQQNLSWEDFMKMNKFLKRLQQNSSAFNHTNAFSRANQVAQEQSSETTAPAAVAFSVWKKKSGI